MFCAFSSGNLAEKGSFFFNIYFLCGGVERGGRGWTGENFIMHGFAFFVTIVIIFIFTFVSSQIQHGYMYVYNKEHQ